MSKGTKVLRFGRIQKIIDELKLEKNFYVLQLSSGLISQEGVISYKAYITQIESFIRDLEALGE